MEKSHLLPVSLVLILVFSAFNSLSDQDSGFKISVTNLNHDLNEGLKPSEFAKLTIASIDKAIEVESFEITLARGNRAVSILTIESDTFDLREFQGKARSGDRIVIQIINISDNEDLLLPNNSVFTLKVN